MSDVTGGGRELGVRYVLEGSVRTSGNRVRVAAQLIDGETGVHLWADQSTARSPISSPVQDDLTDQRRRPDRANPVAQPSSNARAASAPTTSMPTTCISVRCHSPFTAMPEDADKGLTLLARAVELEPDYAAAHAMIAWCQEQRYLRGGLHDEAKQAALLPCAQGDRRRRRRCCSTCNRRVCCRSGRIRLRDRDRCL